MPFSCLNDKVSTFKNKFSVAKHAFLFSKFQEDNKNFYISDLSPHIENVVDKIMAESFPLSNA